MIRQTLTLGLIADLTAMVLYLIDPNTILRTALLVGSPSIGLVIALTFHRFGYPRIAGWIGVAMATIGVIGVFSHFWGINEHQGVFLAVGIVCSGLIMGPRASLVATVLTLAYAMLDYLYGPMSWVAVSYEPSRLERATDLGIALILTGILSGIGMDRVHRLLREQTREQAFRTALLQESPTPTLVVDARDSIVDANAAAAELCGQPAANLAGTPLSRWLQVDEFGGATLYAATGTVPVRFRVARVDSMGRERKVVVLVDLRPEREVMQKQTEAVRLAQEASHAKSAFLASMSHELRTPLNAIIGYAELLDEESANDQQQADLGRILAAGRHLLELVDDVLDMSKIEAGKTEVQWEYFDLAEILHEAVGAVEGEAIRHRVRLELRCPTTVFVRADRLRCRQVVLNLLSNALRFARSTVILDVADVDDMVRITCSDDGEGVPKDLAPRLFQPFVRGNTSASRTGLGLALSRELADRMGGSLQLGGESTLPGACFVFELQSRDEPTTGAFAVPRRKRNPSSLPPGGLTK